MKIGDRISCESGLDGWSAYYWIRISIRRGGEVYHDLIRYSVQGMMEDKDPVGYIAGLIMEHINLVNSPVRVDRSEIYNVLKKQDIFKNANRR